MAILLNNPAFAPATLTGLANGIVENANQVGLAQFFPSVTSPSTFFAWENNAPLSDEAFYRATSAETRIGDSAGRERVSAELHQLGLKKVWSEGDRLRAINNGDAEAAELQRLAAEVTKAVTNKLEKLRAQALVTGALDIQDTTEGPMGATGFRAKVDFGRKPAFTTTAGTLFSADGADPVAYLLGLVDQYRAENGVDPTDMIVSGRVLAALGRSAAVASYAGTRGSVVPQSVVQDTLVLYGLPPVTVFDGHMFGSRLIPDDRVIFVNRDSAGATVWGPSTAALNPLYGVSSEGIFVGAYQEQDADSLYVRSDATALPILTRANLTLSAKVL